MSDSTSTRTSDMENDDHLISDILKQYTRHWKWFIVIVAVFVGLAHLYLRYVTPVYATQATILLKDEKGGGGLSELAALEDLGVLVGGSGAKLSDQIAILNSRRLMEEVVKELNLNVQYFSEGNVKNLESYIAPVVVSFLNKDTLNYISGIKTFRLFNEGNGSFRLEQNDDQSQQFRYGQSINLGFGAFNVVPREGTPGDQWDDILVRVGSPKMAAASYAAQVSIASRAKNSNVLILSMKNPVERKSRDIINTLIDKYNLDASKDKNEVAANTAEFIANRILIISEELDSVETNKAVFKRDNRLTDIPTEAALVVNSNNELKTRILEVSTQIAIGEDLADYIVNNKTGLLPSNLGVVGGNLQSQITAYNNLIMQRDNLLISSTPENPVVVTLDTELAKMRATIQSGIQNELASLEIKLNDLQGQSRIYSGQIASVPGLEKTARGIVRQQEIKEELYLYLLKKREETAISMAINSENAKVIDEAITSPSPVSPKRGLIKLIAGILGFVVVLIIIYIKNLLDVKIHSRSDVEQLTRLPILGELPYVEGEENHVITKYDRSILAESFRILRTNLDYFTRAKDGEKRNVVYVTSTIKGEGKTFVAFNLAVTLASTGKKVLLVGADIRNPQVHRYMDLASSTIGLSEYMFDTSVSTQDIITTKEMNGQIFDVILSGRIPPNPAELFLNSRFDTLINELSQGYDYVVVDTAPTMQVTDTLLISQYADVTIFVTRAEYTQKRLLQYSKDLNTENKVKNMAYVVNSVKSNNFGYGAKYGYGYGNEEDGFWQKMKQFLSGK
ncbi:MAG: polysaccharide biosynthesis tyrosine autokinase [Dokdonia sp.]|jgi:capsular exopolysaccharide synthesis family protein